MLNPRQMGTGFRLQLTPSAGNFSGGSQDREKPVAKQSPQSRAAWPSGAPRTGARECAVPWSACSGKAPVAILAPDQCPNLVRARHLGASEKSGGPPCAHSSCSIR
jgi:hypothetical protein